MADETYVPKNPGDPLYAQDWNEMQEKIKEEVKTHDHTAIGGKITNKAIADNAIGTPQIKDGAVTAGKIAKSAVGGDQLMTGIIKTEHLANRRLETNAFYTNTIPTHCLQRKEFTIQAGVGHTEEQISAPLIERGIRMVSEDYEKVNLPGKDYTYPGIGPNGKIILMYNYQTVSQDGTVSKQKRYLSGDRAPNFYVKTSDDSISTAEEWTILMRSSRELKENIAEIGKDEAISALEQLEPVKFDYIGAKSFRPTLGFIAEDMPEPLVTEDRKTISPFEIVPVLTKVVKEQQRTIEKLQSMVEDLMARLDRTAPSAG